MAKKTELKKGEACSDAHCPTHGTLTWRGRTLTGTIKSAKMRRSAVCEIERTQEIRKYQRYERRVSRLKVHNPDCIAAKEGDKVRIAECHPISKTKAFVIVEKVL